MTRIRAETYEDHTLLIPDAAERARFKAIVEQARSLPLYAQSPDVARIREGFAAFADSPLARPMPANVTMRREVGSEVEGWWFIPPEPHRATPILYFHGGGYIGGSVAGSRGMAGALALAFGAPLLAAVYRQAPEAPFPAAIEDARRSYQWLACRRKERIIVVGESAGASLAVLAGLHAVDAGLPSPSGIIAISGIFDFSMSGESWHRNRDLDVVTPAIAPHLYATYLAGADPGQPDASPLNRPIAGLAPLLVLCGSHEVMADDSAMLAAHGRRCGVDVQHDIYADMPHNFVKFASSASDAAIGRMVAWARTHQSDELA